MVGIICPGEWLLDPRLLNKGTLSTLFHNGRYENQCGFIILKKVPSSVTESVTVKVRFSQSQWPFHPRYLLPEMTPENPPFVPAEAAQPIVSVIGKCVVIVGPDLYNNSSAVGSYGQIVQSGYQMLP